MREFDEYINKDIGTIRKDVPGGLLCYASPDGLPERLINYPFVQLPKTYVRLIGGSTETTIPGEALDAYLQEKLGFVKDKDYIRHSKGERHGVFYFDFHKKDAIQRLESYATEHGWTPWYQADAGDPLYLAREKEHVRREMERRQAEKDRGGKGVG